MIRYFDMAAWERCCRADLPTTSADLLHRHDLMGRRAIASISLASRTDIAALELLVLPIGEVPSIDDPFLRFGWYFVPEDRAQAASQYRAWDCEGLLTVVPGQVSDGAAVLKVLERLNAHFDLKQVVYDPFSCGWLGECLAQGLYPTVAFRSQVMNFSLPMLMLSMLIAKRQIRHGDCPVMHWQMGNVIGEATAPFGQPRAVFPRKAHADDRIDSPVALIAALGVAFNFLNQGHPA